MSTHSRRTDSFASETMADVRPRLLWSVRGEGRGTPAADEASVYFLSKRHLLTAIDRRTGAVKWTAGTGGAAPATEGSVVALAGERVIAGDDRIVAFERADGRLLWRFVPDHAYGLGFYLGAATAELVFCGSPVGRVYGIDAQRGTLRWEAQAGAEKDTTVFAPVTDGRLVVAAFTAFVAPNNGGVVALDAETGREYWRTAFPRARAAASSGAAGGPLLLGSLVVAAAGDGTIFGLSSESGAVKWTISPLPGRAGGDPPPDFRPMASDGHTLVVGSLSGIVVAYELEHLRQIWRNDEGGASIAFGMAVADGRVYVPYLSGELRTLDLRTGRERWRVGGAQYGFSWTPLARDHVVYASGSSAGSFAFRD